MSIATFFEGVHTCYLQLYGMGVPIKASGHQEDFFMGITDVEIKSICPVEFLKEGKETPRVLLMLDNMESITGTEQAVGSRLEKEEQKRLIGVLKQLIRSSIKILMGSRAEKEWLEEHTFKDSVYALEGLDRVSRFDLAERIMGDTEKSRKSMLVPKLYSIQPVFPFFLGEQVAHFFDESGQAVLEQGFCRYMSKIAVFYIELMKSKRSKEKQMGFNLSQKDREILYKALHRLLDNESDFYDLYHVFVQFYHLNHRYNEAIELLESVVKKLDLYSKKDREFLEKYGYVMGNLGTYYMQIKDFPKAKSNQEKALALIQQAGKRNQQPFPPTVRRPMDAAKAIEALEISEETKKELRTLLENIKKVPSND